GLLGLLEAPRRLGGGGDVDVDVDLARLALTLRDLLLRGVLLHEVLRRLLDGKHPRVRHRRGSECDDRAGRDDQCASVHFEISSLWIASCDRDAKKRGERRSKYVGRRQPVPRQTKPAVRARVWARA